MNRSHIFTQFVHAALQAAIHQIRFVVIDLAGRDYPILELISNHQITVFDVYSDDDLNDGIDV